MEFLLRIGGITLIFVGAACDYASTRYGLSRGATELNPVVRALGVFNTKFFSSLLLSWLAWRLSARQTWHVGLAIFALSLLVSIWNLVITWRLR